MIARHLGILSVLLASLAAQARPSLKLLQRRLLFTREILAAVSH